MWKHAGFFCSPCGLKYLLFKWHILANNETINKFTSHSLPGYVFKTNANAKEFLISNESFMKLEEGEMDQYLVERATATMSDSQIAAFLDRHNKLRGETVPAASNMNYLVTKVILIKKVAGQSYLFI